MSDAKRLTPEERAAAVIHNRGLTPVVWEHEIASAIRAAEDDALERAAREVESLATGLDECEEAACDHSASDQAMATAKRIRALKGGSR